LSRDNKWVGTSYYGESRKSKTPNSSSS